MAESKSKRKRLSPEEARRLKSEQAQRGKWPSPSKTPATKRS